MSLWFFPIHSCGAIMEHLPMHEKLTKYGKLTAHNERKIPKEKIESLFICRCFFTRHIFDFLRTYIVTLVHSIPKKPCATLLDNKLSPRFLLFHHNCFRLFLVYFQVKFGKNEGVERSNSDNSLVYTF